MATDREDKRLCIYCAQWLPEVRGATSTASLDIAEIPECGAEYTERFLCCTREPGHEGEHISCGLHFHDIQRWNDAALQAEREGGSDDD